MSKWFGRIAAKEVDYELVLQAMEYFENELIQARAEVKLSGRIETNSSTLPGIVEYRYQQLQEVEAILRHLEIQMARAKRDKFVKYFEKYNKELTAREADKYAESDEEILAISEIINQVAFVRNQYLAIHKGLDAKSWQLNNIVKLRSIGIEDAEI